MRHIAYCRALRYGPAQRPLDCNRRGASFVWLDHWYSGNAPASTAGPATIQYLSKPIDVKRFGAQVRVFVRVLTEDALDSSTGSG